MMQSFNTRTETEQNVSPVLSIALPEVSREVGENNTSWSCWELKTEDERITQGKGGETTENQDEINIQKIVFATLHILFGTELVFAKYKN